MKLKTLTLLVFAALLVAPAVLAEEGVEVHRVEQQFFPGDAKKFEADLSVGDIKIVGAAQRNVEVDVRFFCNRQNLEACRRQAEKIYLESRTRRSTFELLLQGTPKARVLRGLRAEMEIRIPRDMRLEVDLRAGAVEVAGMREDMEINVGAGDVEIDFPKRRTDRVKVDVGVGKVHLWVDDAEIRGSGFPRSVRWDGKGDAEINVDMGTGDVDIRLQ